MPLLRSGILHPGCFFVGTFSQDTDQREVFFTLQQAGTVVLRTYAYAGRVNSAGTTISRGGFDPTLTVFDSSGRLIASNEDGGCGAVAPDAVTGLCWDSYLDLALPAGNYRLVLTQSTNTAIGPTLADSFKYACGAANQTAGVCTQNFTPDPNPGVLLRRASGTNPAISASNRTLWMSSEPPAQSRPPSVALPLCRSQVRSARCIRPLPLTSSQRALSVEREPRDTSAWAYARSQHRSSDRYAFGRGNLYLYGAGIGRRPTAATSG